MKNYFVFIYSKERDVRKSKESFYMSLKSGNSCLEKRFKEKKRKIINIKYNEYYILYTL